jgi:hypothetical protein
VVLGPRNARGDGTALVVHRLLSSGRFNRFNRDDPEGSPHTTVQGRAFLHGLVRLPKVSIVQVRDACTLGRSLAECIDIAGPESRGSPWFSATPPVCIPGGGGVWRWPRAGMPTQHIDRFVTITASTANRSLHCHGPVDVGGAEDVVAESGERHTMFRAKEFVP